MENAYWGRGPLPTDPVCPNCGQRYHVQAMGPHIKRCRRLRPKGGTKSDPFGAGSTAFDGMWGVSREDRPLPSMLEKLGNSLKLLVAGDASEAVDGPGSLSDEEEKVLGAAERQRLRKLFDKFDANGDGALSQAEHGLLLDRPSLGSPTSATCGFTGETNRSRSPALPAVVIALRTTDIVRNAGGRFPGPWTRSQSLPKAIEGLQSGAMAATSVASGYSKTSPSKFRRITLVADLRRI